MASEENKYRRSYSMEGKEAALRASMKAEAPVRHTQQLP